MNRYAIGLGSNQGDRLEHLRFALRELEALGGLVGVSSLYETEPIGGPEQPPYLNAVVVVDCDLDATILLSRLQGIEADAGRVRDVRWGPRTLDLDILTSDGAKLREERLVIPHPRAREREFVLRPLVELWPEADVGGETAAVALERLEDQGVDLLRRRWRDDSDLWIGRLLVAVQMVWFLVIAFVFVFDGALPDTVGFTSVTGGALALFGIVLAVSAVRRLGRSLTAVPEPVTGSDLIEAGPYALARHPIYGGVVLFLAGAALLFDTVLGLVLVVGLTGFFVMKSSYEERRLRSRYAGYRSYSRRVRHRLIPFLF